MGVLRVLFGYSVNEAKDFVATYSKQQDELYFNDKTAGSFVYGAGIGVESNLNFPVDFSIEYDYLLSDEARLGSGSMSLAGMGWDVKGISINSNIQILLFSIIYKIR